LVPEPLDSRPFAHVRWSNSGHVNGAKLRDRRAPRGFSGARQPLSQRDCCKYSSAAPTR
jgi:hypothetical protein